MNATNACTASSSRQLTYDVTKADHEADVNIRKLDAFIQNRNNVVEVQEIIPDSAPRVHDLGESNVERIRAEHIFLQILLLHLV